MRVTLDGETVCADGSEDQTLQGLIDCVCDGSATERLVVSVAVDGRELFDRDLSDRLGQPVGNAETVELQTADRRELAADALREVAARLAQGAGRQAELAGLIHAGRFGDAVGALTELLDGWQDLRTVIEQSGRVLNRDLTDAEHDGRPVHAHLAELAAKLREVRDAFEARDTVLLADLIEYEMPGACTAWRDILQSIAGHIETNACIDGDSAKT